MPELPEVETIRQDLLSRIRNQKITEVIVRLPKSIRGGVEEFQNILTHNTVDEIDRTGKLLQFVLREHDRVLLLHLKMTGQLLYQHGTDFAAGGHPFPAFSEPLPNKYTHIEFGFANGGRLFFNDLRQFGYMQLVTPEQRRDIVGQYGLEPLRDEYTFESLQKAFKRRGVLKVILLDQRIFSGLGNIYADEVCFAAGVRPDRRVETLTEAEQYQLFLAMPVILTDALAHRGTSFRDYRDSEGREGGYAKFLKVYGREGEPCLRCGTSIEKMRLAGRGTHFCPRCQK